MTITSKDTGCITAVPANDNMPFELRALGAAIGKASTAILPPVIALTGLAGSGKSTASKYLVEKHGYQLVKFAGPLKDMLRAIGLSEAQIEGELKEEPCEWLQGARRCAIVANPPWLWRLITPEPALPVCAYR